MESLGLLALSLGIKLAAVVIALLVVVPFAVLFSRWLDKRAGIHFAYVIVEMRRDPKALAAYFGRRIGALFIAVAIAVGLALS